MQMNNFDKEKIEQIINLSDSESDNDIPQELYGVIYSLGRDAENEEEFDYALDLLLRLCERKNARVRSQAILGISLLSLNAEFNRKLNRATIEPIIIREWKNAVGDDIRGAIAVAADDINLALGWYIPLTE